ncbi:MAG: nucleotidyltransferase domain-containing protein [Candidatus Poribacteria bacterium]|nr:nucleotidyltransferase domain-containing protein [Candidatus Poribacteria bacterium]
MNGLSEKTISQLHRVFESYKEIDQVLIYGSRAKGDFRPGSDIDLTFRGSNLTHNLMLEIGNQIDDLILPYKVDLSLYATLSPDLKEHIQQVGQSFYQR